LRPALSRTLALIEHRNKPNEPALEIVRNALLTLRTVAAAEPKAAKADKAPKTDKATKTDKRPKTGKSTKTTKRRPQ